MKSSIETKVISAAPLEQRGMDFKYLREEGIKHIQKLAGKIWTDYNEHDPGVTILEQLCYAINDLSYRIDFDMKDLMVSDQGGAYENLYSPAQILTVNPVTLFDLRKIVIDVPGVRNAWVEKVTTSKPDIFINNEDKSLSLTNPDGTGEQIIIKGLYRVLIEKKELTYQDVQPQVKQRLLECRNIAEDFAEVLTLEPELITLSGYIELGEVEDISQFAARLLFKIANFISPQINFFTLHQMLEMGKSMDEIMDGPALQHGFILDEELEKHERKSEIHTSDIIRELMDIEGVKGVNGIVVSNSAKKEDWRLILDKDRTPRLDLDTTLQVVKFVKNDLVLAVDPVLIRSHYQTLLETLNNTPLSLQERDVVNSDGTNRNVSNYYSFQNHFPETYGIGEFGLPESADLHRKAQANQLKAYLLFFDQILANYYMQVAHLKDLFTFSSNEAKTYFSQSILDSVPGAKSILRYDTAEEYETWLNEISEKKSEALERKNRFLNHLIARFSETFIDYSLWLHDYGIASKNNHESTQQQIIDDKLNFLKSYPKISNERAKAFNYSEKSWGTENISGLEKRIAGKLGIKNFTRRSLSEFSEPFDPNAEGFHLLEHILLRPVKEDYNAYHDFLLSKAIQGFEKVDAKFVKCLSAKHGLQNGSTIQIFGTKKEENQRYDNTYKVSNVLPDSFHIQASFDSTVNIASEQLTPIWIRTQVDTRFLILSIPVLKFEASPKASTKLSRCTSPKHGLSNGEVIEINGTQSYNGKYAVSNVSPDTFDIEKPYVMEEFTGRWMNVNQKKDPYSLQLTFIFPDWVHRFKNTNFRSFIEKTIREETPVHLTVYIRWLSAADMAKFETSYQNFLDQLLN